MKGFLSCHTCLETVLFITGNFGRIWCLFYHDLQLIEYFLYIASIAWFSRIIQRLLWRVTDYVNFQILISPYCSQHLFSQQPTAQLHAAASAPCMTQMTLAVPNLLPNKRPLPRHPSSTQLLLGYTISRSYCYTHTNTMATILSPPRASQWHMD